VNRRRGYVTFRQKIASLAVANLAGIDAVVQTAFEEQRIPPCLLWSMRSSPSCGASLVPAAGSSMLGGHGI
jgi:hypothetical protein